MNRAQPRSRTKGFQRYLITAVLIRLADEGARVALVLLALERTNSAAVGGLLVAVLLVPQVVAAPAIGLLTDRASQPRWVLTLSVAGFAASMATVAFLLGRVPLPVVVVLLLVGGCCGPSLTGGLTSQLPRLVSESSLPWAFGADSLTYNVSGIAGPAIAAVIAGAAGAGDCDGRSRRHCGRRRAGIGHRADPPAGLSGQREASATHSRLPRSARRSGTWNRDSFQYPRSAGSRRPSHRGSRARLSAASARCYGMADDGCRYRCTYRFIAVDLASGAARPNADDGDDRADWNRRSAGHCCADYRVAALDRRAVWPVGNLCWSLHRSDVHYAQALCAPMKYKRKSSPSAPDSGSPWRRPALPSPGPLAGLPSPTLLIFVAMAPLVAGGVGALILRNSRAEVKLELQV